MSDRGSILISTANDIGEALVEKLGGEGYAPSVWDKEYNKLGIAEVDSAPALSVLENSSETGTARGSILMSTANAIGAMLNKKYNTDRGFKPKEWASACRKMKPLETDTKSGSIAHITDGADEVPIKSWEVEIAPTLTGKSAIEATQTGKNLVDGTNFTSGLPSTTIGASIDTISASTRYAYFGTPIKGGSYTVSSVSNDTDYFWNILIFGYTNGVLSVYTNTSVNTSKTVDFSACDYIRLAIGTRSASYQVSTDLTEYGTIQLEVGSTATTYEPYTAPTVSTVNLGRTIYGGTADIVNGTGTDENGDDFTFTPITPTPETALGVNNFWADEGDSEIEYYAIPTAYTRGTSSGAIANVQSARTDLPFTRVKANIAPSIIGTDEVEVKNLNSNNILSLPPVDFDLFGVRIYTVNGVLYMDGTSNREISSTRDEFKVLSFYLPSGTYYFTRASYGLPSYIYRYSDKAQIRVNNGSFTLTEGTLVYMGYYIYNKTFDNEKFNQIVNIGSSAIAYEDTDTPTTYTADLGEPVYGGSVDLVSGEVVKDCTKGSMSSTYLSGLNSDYIGYEASTAYFNNHPSVWVRNWNYQTAAPRVSGGIKCACDEFPVSMHNTTIFSAQYRIYFDVYEKNITSVQDFIDYVEDLEQNGKSLDITYEVATPTESSITPQVISPSEGVNNLWNNAGGDTDVEYFEQE